MSTLSNAVPESSREAPGITPAIARATRPFYWSVRRELWENRSIYIAPLAVGAVFLFGFLLSTVFRLPAIIRGLPMMAPAKQQAEILTPYDFAAGALMLTQMLVGLFYSLDALHGERRDRSILFWKSLPLSDATAVLSKAAVPVIIVPLLAGAATVVVYVAMFLLSSAVVAGSGLSVHPMWVQLPLFQLSLGILFHLVVVHGLWHAPFYGWFMLVSGWARRAVILWASLPWLALIAFEKIVFNSSHVASLLINRLAGDNMSMATGSMAMDLAARLGWARTLISPGLWLGLLVTAGFLFVAVRVRRSRGPI
ncbi:MAG TPA: ABC transporter permease [Terriglobia bacterium]|nr:ABC transporter permease [Terriglobia bacterium]